jgi:hypothetical protein
VKAKLKQVAVDEHGRPTTLDARGSAEFFSITARAAAGELQIFSLIAAGVARWAFKVGYLRPPLAMEGFKNE